MKNLQEIFDRFADQNWDANRKLQLFIQWFDCNCTGVEHVGLDFESFLQKQANEENVVREDEPTVNFTARQISRSGAWLSFCDWSGMGEYAMNEGQCEPDEVFKIPLSKAKDWRLV